MAGLEVTRSQLDMKSAEAIIALRDAVAQAETIQAFLSTIPVAQDGTDPLVVPELEGGFGYTADEAYLIRFLFQSITDLPIDNLREQGRKLTGLQ